MPADLQKRIANAVAPNVDWNDAAVKNAARRDSKSAAVQPH
jgi:hypothetical protein